MSIDLASYIDHTLLDEAAALGDLDRLCSEALRFGFRAVCVYPGQVRLVADKLGGTMVLPITVVGFPGGEESTAVKVEQTARAVRDGALEIDMVLNRRLLEAADFSGVLRDIGAVVAEACPRKVKVILETGALTRDRKIIAASLAKAAGAAFVKTSTGFGPGGATVADIKLLRSTVGADMGVKASGGITTRQQALDLIEAGADRIGASRSVTFFSRNES